MIIIIMTRKISWNEKNGILTQEEFNILKVGIIKKFGSPSIETTNSDVRVTNSESIGTTKDSEVEYYNKNKSLNISIIVQ
jgi:hypothetical protein